MRKTIPCSLPLIPIRRSYSSSTPLISKHKTNKPIYNSTHLPHRTPGFRMIIRHRCTNFLIRLKSPRGSMHDNRRRPMRIIRRKLKLSMIHPSSIRRILRKPEYCKMPLKPVLRIWKSNSKRRRVGLYKFELSLQPSYPFRTHFYYALSH